MQQPTPSPRPVWVTALGIIFLVIGGLSVLMALVLLVGGVAIAGIGSAQLGRAFSPLVGAIAGGMLVALAFFFMLFAAVSIVAGIGLLQGRRWARILALVLLWVAGISSLFGFLGSLGTGQFGPALVDLIVLGVYALFLWKFYTNPVRAYFKGGLASPPPAPAAPPPPPPATPGAPTAGPA